MSGENALAIEDLDREYGGFRQKIYTRVEMLPPGATQHIPICPESRFFCAAAWSWKVRSVIDPALKRTARLRSVQMDGVEQFGELHTSSSYIESDELEADYYRAPVGDREATLTARALSVPVFGSMIRDPKQTLVVAVQNPAEARDAVSLCITWWGLAFDGCSPQR